MEAPESQPEKESTQTDDEKLEAKMELIEKLNSLEEHAKTMITDKTNMPNAPHKRYMYLAKLAHSLNTDLHDILSNPLFLNIRSQELLTHMPYIQYIITFIHDPKTINDSTSNTRDVPSPSNIAASDSSDVMSHVPV